MGGFQSIVNAFPAPGVEGDFASANPRATALAGPGGLVCGPSGVVVGRFAWVNTVDNITTSNYGTAPNAPDGFVHRDQQGLIPNYLEIASLLVPQGFPITLHRSGDFWVRNYGPAALTKGATVYAGYADGKAYSSAPSGASATGSLGSTNTAAIGATFTASAASNPLELVVTSVTGFISIGDFLAGTGITPGTTIASQVSGTPNGAGTYLLSQTNTTSAATVTSYGDVLDVSATTGLISIGDTVSGGSGFPVGAVVKSQVSGTVGGAGIYLLSAPATQYVASATGVTTFGTMIDVTAVGSGVLAPGQPVSGTGIPANASIVSQVSGAVGGVGIYVISVAATAYAASTTITEVGGIASGWKAYPTNSGDGAVGALVKITNSSAGL